MEQKLSEMGLVKLSRFVSVLTSTLEHGSSTSPRTSEELALQLENESHLAPEDMILTECWGLSGSLQIDDAEQHLR